MPHAEGTIVRVHYRGTLEDGVEFDTSRGGEPLEFTVGMNQVIPGFESAVTDLAVGESAEVTIAPEDAYGPYHDEAIQIVPFTAFAQDPCEGAVVQLLGPEGEQIAATITKVDGEDVTLDFNHPLAGKALTFEIELVEFVTEQG